MSIQYQEPFKAFRFLVEVENGGVVVAAFSQFSGVKLEVETIQARSGNDDRGVQEVVPVLTRFAPVTLTKGVVGDNDFLNWLFSAAAGVHAGPSGENLYRTLNVVALDDRGNRGVTWSLKNALPIGYELARPKPKQKYLTSEELHRIMVTPMHNRTLYHVRDLFLFSCFTGISYIDMCLLSDEHLSLAEDGVWWIKSARKKSGVDFEIPLMELPLHIIEKYRDMAPEGKLLPMYSNSSLNHYLKQIAGLCGIERKLVFHAARHTYATEITLSHGVPLETVSKMLGHRQIKTTQIYAKVTDNKIDADTRTLNKKISERFSVVI